MRYKTFGEYRGQREATEFNWKFTRLCEHIVYSGMTFEEYWESHGLPAMLNSRLYESVDELLLEVDPMSQYYSKWRANPFDTGGGAPQTPAAPAAPQGPGMWDRFKGGVSDMYNRFMGNAPGMAEKGSSQSAAARFAADPVAAAGGNPSAPPAPHDPSQGIAPGSPEAAQAQQAAAGAAPTPGATPPAAPPGAAPQGAGQAQQSPEQQKKLGQHQEKADKAVNTVKQRFGMAMKDFLKAVQTDSQGKNDPYTWQVAKMFHDKLNQFAKPMIDQFKVKAQYGQNSGWMQDFQNQRQGAINAGKPPMAGSSGTFDFAKDQGAAPAGAPPAAPQAKPDVYGFADEPAKPDVYGFAPEAPAAGAPPAPQKRTAGGMQPKPKMPSPIPFANPQ